MEIHGNIIAISAPCVFTKDNGEIASRISFVASEDKAFFGEKEHYL